MPFKVFRNDGINWVWYNAESKGGAAIAFRIHKGDDQAEFEKQFKVEEGSSCPVRWANLKFVPRTLLQGMEELKPVVDFMEKHRGTDSMDIACPCNSSAEKEKRIVTPEGWMPSEYWKD